MVLIASSALGVSIATAQAGGEPEPTAESSATAPEMRADSREAVGRTEAPLVSDAASPIAGEPALGETDGRVVAAFSRSGGRFPEGWRPLEFEKIPSHTRYSFEREGEAWVVRADAQASASGMTRAMELDLTKFPILRWRWKVAGVLQKSDVTRKAGDDYAARIYIAFKYEPERVGFLRRAQYTAGRALFGDIPIGAINYIWASRGNPGEIYDNPFAGSFVKMIPVESGAERAGEWIEEQRNVLEDYVRAFGEDPPLIEGVAIMTDTDNTGESITAWYGDIEFLSKDAAGRRR